MKEIEARKQARNLAEIASSKAFVPGDTEQLNLMIESVMWSLIALTDNLEQPLVSSITKELFDVEAGVAEPGDAVMR